MLRRRTNPFELARNIPDLFSTQLNYLSIQVVEDAFCSEITAAIAQSAQNPDFINSIIDNNYNFASNNQKY